MTTIDSDSIAVAAIRTRALVLDRRPGIDAHEFAGDGDFAGTCPISTTGRIAHALFSLDEIPRHIAGGHIREAFAALIASQTVLWVIGVIKSDEAELINEESQLATATMA